MSAPAAASPPRPWCTGAWLTKLFLKQGCVGSLPQGGLPFLCHAAAKPNMLSRTNFLQRRSCYGYWHPAHPGLRRPAVRPGGGGGRHRVRQRLYPHLHHRRRGQCGRYHPHHPCLLPLAGRNQYHHPPLCVMRPHRRQDRL